MGRPTKVAGEGDTEVSCLIDNFEGVKVWEMELRKEIKILGSVQGDDFVFLKLIFNRSGARLLVMLILDWVYPFLFLSKANQLYQTFIPYLI